VVKDGFLTLNDKPGWGIELDEKLCAAHREIPIAMPRLFRPDGAVCDCKFLNSERIHMIHKNIEFHNVGELGRREGYSGLFLYRYPADVREHMIQLGQVASTNSSGVEIRFCTDTEWGSVTLFRPIVNIRRQTAGKVELYKGDFFCGSYTVKEASAMHDQAYATPSSP